MLQSKLFTKTLRDTPKDEMSLNAQLLLRAGYIDKVMAGVYTLLPLGLRTFRKIEAIIRSEMEELGAQEISMPGLQPKANWETTERYDTYDALFRFTSYYSETEYVLGPTHEEIVSPLLKKYIQSYKQLPTAVFQIQTKFRDEKRAKSGLLRGREFTMKDLYSFHKDEADLDTYYDAAAAAYRRIFDRTGIGEQTYYTFASGGTFAKYSHEYQTLTEAGEDLIYICDTCHIAINKEVIADQSTCPQCGNANLHEEKAVEVGNIFKLKTKYSVPFELTYKDEQEGEHPVIMGCYGIGLGRLMGTIVEVNHDEQGICWPSSVAPFTIHLIRIESSDVATQILIDKTCTDLYDDLQKAGIEVLYDDRIGLGAGEKFKDSDLIGIPWRCVISEKTLAKNSIEVKARHDKTPSFIPFEDSLAALTAMISQ